VANFVSNGGYKLEKAITDFNFNPTDMVCADIGASNGGFTDCLLKHGAKKVFAIDVNSSQLDPSLICDKVVVVDNCNARYLTYETLGEKVDLVVCDVSFISLKLVLPAVFNILKENGKALMLIKPQFECGKEYLGNSGIVKSKQARINACLDIYNFSLNIGLTPLDITNAPIKEKKNIEYVIMLEKGGSEPFSINKIYNVL
jgi:23S rRNA (cytidine1920-2'-O)/16S rRNA (cytidine1409-2'-O)-methyltransferase